MGVLVLLGTLLPMHIKVFGRTGRNLRTGFSLLGLFGLLILTGYGLYYFGGERVRHWTSAVHLWVGLVFPLVISIHVWRGKTTRTAKPGSA